MNDGALYLEVDEDITSAIDKLGKVDGDTVRIVVPKRSTILQSLINQKLLKKAAADAGKELVLVTGDKVAAGLAARVGLAVAPNLGAKPVISEVEAQAPDASDDVIDGSEPEVTRGATASAGAGLATRETAKPKKPLFSRKAVGGTAAASAPAVAATEVAEAAVTPAEAPEALATARNTRVPNFGRLRRRLVWGGLAVLLIGGYFGYMALFSSAQVTLYASGARVSIDAPFVVTTTGTTNVATATIAGRQVGATRQLAGTATATGKEDQGTKSSGAMTVVNNDPSAHQFDPGTRFVAADGKIFRTTEAVRVEGASVGFSGFRPVVKPAQATVNVVADANGDAYNEAPGRYTIPGLTAEQQQYTYGQGAQMNGGTSKVVTILTQADVDKAKAALLDEDKDNVEDALKGKAAAGDRVLTGSQQQSVGETKASPAVGEEATEAAVTVAVNYTQLVVDKSDFSTFIKALEQKEIGQADEIYSDGIENGTIDATGKSAGGGQSFNFKTDAYHGRKLDRAAIAGQLTGLRYGDALTAAKGQPGVQNADVTLSPAWATKLPGSAQRITVSVEVAGR